MTAPYLRYPHLSGDLLTFVAADDVWLAPVDGGRAWRLTDEHAPAINPRLSPEATHVAWAAVRGRGREVFCTEVDGGSITQLTFWGSPQTNVLGWTEDGRILVSSAAGEHQIRDWWLKAIDLDGHVEPLAYGPASGLARGADGTVVVGSAWAREPAYWKRYRGGTAAQLWIDRAASGRYERLLPDLDAGLAWPMWLDGRIAFVSDHNGVGNVWSVDADGGDLRAHTHHGSDDGYVRTASTDGTRITYHALGDVFVMDTLETEPHRVPISLGGALTGRDRRRLVTDHEVASARPTHDGAGVVVQVRGQAFHLTTRSGPARALAATAGVRVRDAQPLGATARSVHVSDASGDDAIEVVTIDGTDPPGVLAAGNLGRVLSMAAAHDGSTVAVVSHDGRILVVDVESGDVDEVGHGTRGEPTGLAFSPDGRWLAWSQPVGRQFSQLRAVDLSVASGNRSSVALTGGRFVDTEPVFTSDGDHLAFLSTRTFDPMYDRYVFAMSIPSGTRPWLLPLRATTPSPFGPSVEGWSLRDPAVQPPTADGEGEQPPPAPTPPAAGPPPPVDIDVDGIEERVVAVPVPAGDYRSLRVADTALLWLHVPVHGVLGTGAAADRPPRPAFERYDLTARKHDVLREEVDGFEVTGDGGYVLLRDRDKLTAVPSDRKVPDDDPSRVDVDLTRIHAELDPIAEWHQMFDETVRLMRDHFWRDDMGGTDWDAVAARYRPLVERAGGHDDVVDLLWETVAELGTSHAYVIPPDDASAPEEVQGLLGADLVVADDGTWSIATILPGESSDPRAASPLRAAGVGAEPGDVVTEVGGKPVDPVFGPGPGLVGTAGSPTELTLQRGDERRRVVVVPLADDEPLRYQAWVADRRRYTAERTDSRVGYLHIPDMMAEGWSQLMRDLTLAIDCEGIVVDVRYNRGGHLSQLVAEMLARRIYGFQLGRHAGAFTYPDHAPRGPIVFVANQWSGSDGDIITAMAQEMGIGPVVGVRTWGGVVGIDGRFTLVDGTAVTQPRYATWIRNRGFTVENHGVDPDIEVAMTPSDWVAGADPQLDTAIDEVLSLLTQHPAIEPPEVP